MKYNVTEYFELWGYINENKFESVTDLFAATKKKFDEVTARQRLTMYWFMMHGDSEVPTDLKFDMIPITDNDIAFIFKNSNVNALSGKSMQDMKLMLRNNSHSLKALSDIGTYDQSKDKYYRTGLKNLDRAMNGLEYGSLTIFTGDSGSGKSTLLNQIFIAEALKQNEQVFLFSGELTEKSTVQWILETMANDQDFEEVTNINTQSILRQVKQDKQKIILKYLAEKILVFTDFSNCTLSNILYHMNIASSKGHKVFIIDNLMMIKAEEFETNKAQSKIADELKKFAKDNNAIVILVAHINKAAGEAITKNSVSGSKDITNLADYVFGLARNEESKYFEDGKESATLSILKNRKNGILRKTNLDFKYERKRFCDFKDGRTDRFNLMKNYYN